MASSLFLPSLVPTKPAQGQVLAELGFQYLEELGSARVYDGYFRVKFATYLDTRNKLGLSWAIAITDYFGLCFRV